MAEGYKADTLHTADQGKVWLRGMRLALSTVQVSLAVGYKAGTLYAADQGQFRPRGMKLALSTRLIWSG